MRVPVALLVVSTLFAPAVALAHPPLSFHIEVVEAGEAKLDLELPFGFVEGLMALLPAGSFAGVDVHIQGDHVDGRDLARHWRTLARRPDRSFVTVRDRDHEVIRLGRVRGGMVLQVEDHDDQVEITMPGAVADALFGEEGDGAQVDIAAMVHALGRAGRGEVRLVSGEDRVRLWVERE